MKVSIIGGAGLVGSSAAFALQCGGIVSEIALLDLNLDLAGGHALDLLHGTPSVADQVIVAGGYEHVPSSDIICITAGLRRKPDESRLDLINRNTDLFLGILADVAKAGLKKDARGRARTLYSLRHTALMFRLLKGDNVDIFLMARNALTSVDQLERFYLSHVESRTKIENLQSFR